MCTRVQVPASALAETKVECTSLAFITGSRARADGMSLHNREYVYTNPWAQRTFANTHNIVWNYKSINKQIVFLFFMNKNKFCILFYFILFLQTQGVVCGW